MNFSIIREMPLPEDIREEQPLCPRITDIKQQRDREIRAIFEDKSDKFLIIIGPCSAHNEDAVCEFVGRLARVQEEVSDKLVLVPRIYTNKPRTNGKGYKGMAHQPNPRKDPDIVAGISAIRRMHIRALKESHLTPADEMLYPSNLPYIEDILSYVAVGARSVENQEHRLTISGLDIPAGMKNPTGGDIAVMLNAIYAAQIPHVFSYNRRVVETQGNALAHSILRGFVNNNGRSCPNYHYEELIHIAEQYQKRHLRHATIIVDTNHNNSNKSYAEQPRIGMEVMRSRKNAPLLKRMIRGLMVESYLVEGSQKVCENVFGKSITDPCLGWEATERFIKTLAEEV